MRETLELFRREPRARVFFLVLTQSAIGTGAAYVALLVLAYERYESPWAISLVLIADLLPAMLLGPVFGAAADRWSRKWCCVVADVVRVVAFLGIAVVDSLEATVALALLAGAGTGLFTPSALASLSSLVTEQRIPAASSVYGAILDLGYTVGPAVAAALLLFGPPETLMLVNGVTFGLSAVALVGIQFGAVPGREPGTKPKSLLAEARDGLRATAGMAGIRIVLLVATAALFFVGLFNVAELLLATQELGASNAGFSILVVLFGAGFIAGSLTGVRGGEPPTLRKRFLIGVVTLGAGLAAAGIAPVFALAMVAFTVAGVGNGAMLVYERLLIQRTVPDLLLGRVFGVRDSLTAWAFAGAFVCGGGFISVAGVRPVVVTAGLGTAVIGLAAAAVLGMVWRGGRTPAPAPRAPAPRLGDRADPLRYGSARQYRANLVAGGEFWLTLLDDLDDRGGDARVELRT